MHNQGLQGLSTLTQQILRGSDRGSTDEVGLGLGARGGFRDVQSVGGVQGAARSEDAGQHRHHRGGVDLVDVLSHLAANEIQGVLAGLEAAEVVHGIRKATVHDAGVLGASSHFLSGQVTCARGAPGVV